MIDIELLKAIADDDEDFLIDDSTLIFQRHGKEYSIIVKTMPNIGKVVSECNGEKIDKSIPEFIQSYLLDLPRLAIQISRTIQNKRNKTNLEYIDAPASVTDSKGNEVVGSYSRDTLLSILENPLPFSSQIIHLMASAGQGKTVLLEELALNLSQTFCVNNNPIPILLPIDLLGRYIGTIDDAIAGSLNNTYNFPMLSQKDIVLCLKKNWICLALDGFDELVARVGASDAFGKITDLLEQLQGNGSLILSARDNFFESHHIIYSMQSFLRPKVGSYAVTTFTLIDWKQEHVEKIFTNYGSKNSKDDYQSLKETFGSDENLLSNPFFVTKICKLWFEKEERFEEIEQTNSHLSRITYIIEVYISRETEEKWITRDGKKIIPYEDHNLILGYIAEEMWRASSFKLNIEELKLATQIACFNSNVKTENVDLIIERIPTHAVFDVSNKLYSFAHDQFFNYYFGYRIAYRIENEDFSEIENIMSEREITPLLSKWVEYNLNQTNNRDYTNVINELQKISAKQNVSLFLRNNIGIILSSLIAMNEHDNFEINRCVFSSDAFKCKEITGVKFKNCEFWKVDFSNSSFSNCMFEDCSFSDLKINWGTKFHDVSFSTGNSITQLSIYKNGSDGDFIFSPFEIQKILEQRKIVFENKFESEEEYNIEVRPDVLKCILKFINKSNKFFNVSIDEMIDEVGRYSKDIGKIGLDTGIFTKKEIRGTNQNIITFACDKNSLLEALRKKVTDQRINSFWHAIVSKFPYKRK